MIPAILVSLAMVSPVYADNLLMIGSGSAGKGGGGYVGPMDVVAGPFVCYSLMACSSSIASGATTAALNIQRASDSHRCDVIATTGVLTGNTANCGIGGDNGQSVGAFCSSTTCTGYEWYDQSGNGHHVTNGDWGWRGVPTLVVNGSPSGTSWSLHCAGTGNCGSNDTTLFLSGQVAPISVSSVGKDASSNVNTPLVQFSSQQAGHSATNTTSSRCAVSTGNAVNATAIDGSWHAIQYVLSTTGYATVDGSANSGSLGAAGNCNIGAGSIFEIAGSDGAAADFAEILVYFTAFTTGQQTSMNGNQHLRFGF